MTLTNRTYLLAAAAALIQTGVLAYMIESRASILRSGKEIVLETVPVDPRDLLRGDYVILSYPLSRLESTKITGTLPPSDGAKPVYVALVPGEGGRHVFSRASWQQITDLKPEEVLIVGKTPESFYMGTETVPLTFGIERYYVPEGEGRPIEEGVREKAVEVVAVVNKAGKAQIRGLRLDGATLYEEPLY
jgi:uncharacterized membrane-anchored protein